MSKFYAVAELVADGESQSMRFFKPTRQKWTSQLKVLAYKAWHYRDGTVVSRIVDAARAEYLLVSYTEWSLRRKIDGVPAST